MSKGKKNVNTTKAKSYREGSKFSKDAKRIPEFQDKLKSGTAEKLRKTKKWKNKKAEVNEDEQELEIVAGSTTNTQVSFTLFILLS